MSITATSLSKSFGAYRALDRVDLHVPAGRLVALLGPSGSGKTTLLRLLAGLEHADAGSGRIRFGRDDVTDTPPGERGVGMVFQHYALFRHLTVRDNVAFGLTVQPRRRRLGAAAIRARVDELLALVQLADLGGRFPGQLSGGQRQRVALARALAVEPRVLLLDEPFGALDAQVRKDLRRWLRSFHDQINLTTVFVTHDQEEALELADEVVVMNKARVEQVGTPQEVFDRPASPFVIEFLGNVNRLTPARPGVAGAIEATGEQMRYVRPHDVELTREPAAGGVVPVVVSQIFAAGSVARIALRCRDQPQVLEAEISRERLRELALQCGDEVAAKFRHVRTFPSAPRGGAVEAPEVATAR